MRVPERLLEVVLGDGKNYQMVPHVSKLNRAKNLSETVMLGGGGSHPGGTMLLDGGSVEKPMLGRYQVEKELGFGTKDPEPGQDPVAATSGDEGWAGSTEHEGRAGSGEEPGRASPGGPGPARPADHDRTHDRTHDHGDHP